MASSGTVRRRPLRVTVVVIMASGMELIRLEARWRVCVYACVGSPSAVLVSPGTKYLRNYYVKSIIHTRHQPPQRAWCLELRKELLQRHRVQRRCPPRQVGAHAERGLRGVDPTHDHP